MKIARHPELAGVYTTPEGRLFIELPRQLAEAVREPAAGPPRYGVATFALERAVAAVEAATPVGEWFAGRTAIDAIAAAFPERTPKAHDNLWRFAKREMDETIERDGNYYRRRPRPNGGGHG